MTEKVQEALLDRDVYLAGRHCLKTGAVLRERYRGRMGGGARRDVREETGACEFALRHVGGSYGEEGAARQTTRQDQPKRGTCSRMAHKTCCHFYFFLIIH